MPLTVSSANPLFSSMAHSLMTARSDASASTIPQAVTELENYYENILTRLEVALLFSQIKSRRQITNK